jgi:hypothetical protein
MLIFDSSAVCLLECFFPASFKVLFKAREPCDVLPAEKGRRPFMVINGRRLVGPSFIKIFSLEVKKQSL